MQLAATRRLMTGVTCSAALVVVFSMSCGLALAAPAHSSSNSPGTPQSSPCTNMTWREAQVNTKQLSNGGQLDVQLWVDRDNQTNYACYYYSYAAVVNGSGTYLLTASINDTRVSSLGNCGTGEGGNSKNVTNNGNVTSPTFTGNPPEQAVATWGSTGVSTACVN